MLTVKMLKERFNNGVPIFVNYSNYHNDINGEYEIVGISSNAVKVCMDGKKKIIRSYTFTVAPYGSDGVRVTLDSQYGFESKEAWISEARKKN